MKDSNVEIEYSTLTRNEGFLGGAIYTLGDMRILQTIFTDNIARVAVRTQHGRQLSVAMIFV